MHFRVCVVVATLFAAAGADDLVAAIKYDLQQDNDDYADLRRARALTSPPRASPPPSAPPTSPTSPPALAPLAPSPAEPAPKFLIPVEKKPHPDIPPPSSFRRTSGQNHTDKESLEVVKVASSYTSFAVPQPKLKTPEPVIVIKHPNDDDDPNANAIEPITETKSTVARTMTTPRITARPVGRARPAFNPRGNDLAPRERIQVGKGVQKSISNIDKEYFTELDDFVKLGSRLKGQVSAAAAGLGEQAPVMRGRWKMRERIRQKGQRGRARGGHHKRVRGATHGDLPDPGVLDMAPARGARVYSKRLRHRLCSRSVLNPEGPKYDSAGNIYLDHFTPRGQGNFGFEQTRAPRLLLPRCCNCCKKSVLGCE